jgi:dephospho-CoA kinase
MQSNDENNTPHIIFITGVSGAGKTTLLNALQAQLSDANIEFLNFDSIGVPTEKEMIEQYGSGAAWQKATLHQWIKKIITNMRTEKFVILDGQVNMDFIKEACREHAIVNYSIILVHCDNHIRHERLNQYRNQPELINAAMDSWANHLRKQAVDNNVSTLDSTSLSIDQMVKWFIDYMSHLNHSSLQMSKSSFMCSRNPSSV